MKLILFSVLFFAVALTSDGSHIVKNFVVFLNGNNLAGTDSELLSELIASPILNNTPRIIPEDAILINYSIKFPYIEDPVAIPLSQDYTMDYFRKLIQENSLNIDVLPLTLLNLFLQKTAPFTDVLMITNAEPESVSNSLQDTLDLMHKKMINVVVTTFDTLKDTPEEISDLYYSAQQINITDEYRRINKLTKAMRSEMFFTKLLKRMLSMDDNKLTRNSTITIINGMAFYTNLQIWDFALHVGVFLSDFNHTQLFSYNGQTMWVHDFSVMYAFENDYVVKIDLTAEYIPGHYIDVLTDHCKNDEIRKRMNNAMKKHIRNHPDDEESVEEYWRKESTKIKFPLKSLVKALIDSLPRSVIYVMADVAPTNIDLMPSILKLMEEKSITVDVSYFGDKSEPTPQEYVQINTASIKAL